MPLSLGPGHAAALKPLAPSPYWGDEAIWDTRANNHNSMLDRDGRVWLAATVRAPENPAFCRDGSDHPSGEADADRSQRAAARGVRAENEEVHVRRTCFGTHHAQFGYDANDTLWTSGGGPVLGWLNTRMFLQTGDAAKSQGWTAFVLDTNGNGKRDEYVGPNDPIDPTKDKRVMTPFYSIMAEPGRRIDLGRRDEQPPAQSFASCPDRIHRRRRWPKSSTCRRPDSARAAPTSTATASSGCRSRADTLASFDRRKCQGR